MKPFYRTVSAPTRSAGDFIVVSTIAALMVSGAAAVAESTDFTAADSTALLLQAAAKKAATRTINDSFMEIPLYFYPLFLSTDPYFFRKKSLNGTPVNLKLSLNLFSR